MKNKLMTIIGALSLSMLIGTTLSSAEERYQTYEMGESGHILFFEMTPEEIAAEDAALANAKMARRLRERKSEVWVETVEFSESGIILEFPMSKEQIRLAKAKSTSSSSDTTAKKTFRNDEPCIVTETIEMGDGNTIVFTSASIDKLHESSRFSDNYVASNCR